MAGRPGRSGGHNRLDPATHLLRGTFNPTRHQAALETDQPAWAPAPGQLKGLGPAGRALVKRLRAIYQCSPVEGELLVEAAMATDRLAQIRALRAACADTKLLLRLNRDEQQWQRQLTMLLQTLRVPTSGRVVAGAPPPSKWAGTLK
jgi:hypothetical protein